MDKNITESRTAHRESLRVADLMELAPDGEKVLEIGARDCRISRLLLQHYKEVTALDLEKPDVVCEGIIPAQGDVTDLRFPDASFDTVFCTEVLEHIDPAKLQQACDGIARTAKRHAVIGVPYKQDLRAGRLKCNHCGRVNPPTGHLNVFDERRLVDLFAGKMKPAEIRLVGYGQRRTNALSTALFGLCGYPFGTYEQEEGCVFCGKKMQRPEITLLNPLKRTACFAARAIDFAQNKTCEIFGVEKPCWIHILFEKQ